MTSRADMEAALEAILFVASEPASRERLLAVFDEGERPAAAEALEAVLERYRSVDDGRGVLVDEAAGGIRLVTRPELHGYLRRFFEVSGKNKLSMAALETLAIVAYRQPVTAPEIQELRGVSSTGVLKTLLDRRLVRIAGRKEVVGKPFLYVTTKEFLLHFGLQNIKDLPPLEEFEDALSAEGASLAAEGPDREEEIFKQVALLAELQDGDAEEAAEVESPDEADDEGYGAGEAAAGVEVGAGEQGEETAAAEATSPAGEGSTEEAMESVAALPAFEETETLELGASESTALPQPAMVEEHEGEPLAAAPARDAAETGDEGSPSTTSGAGGADVEAEGSQPASEAAPGGAEEQARPSVSDAEAHAGARDRNNGGSNEAVTAGAPDEHSGS